MDFDNTPSLYIQIPLGAGPNDVRIVIGQAIPATLQAFYTGLGDPIEAAEIYYDGLGDYAYSALTETGTWVTGVYDSGNNAVRQRTTNLPTLLNWASSDLDYQFPTSLASESWHAMTLQNGWTNRGGVFVTAQYRRVPSPSDSVQLTGCILAGTKTNGTVLANLPVGYRPSHRHGFPCQDTANPAAIEFATNGDLMVFDIGTGSNLQFDVIIPLDA